MDNYLLTIVLVSIGIGLCDLLSNELAGVGRYIKIIGSLIILIAIISPIITLIDDLNNDFLTNFKDSLDINNSDINSKYNEILNGYIINYSIEEVKQYVYEELQVKFSIPQNESEINIITSNLSGQAKIDHLQILLSGASIFKNPYTIEDYFKSLFNCECDVLIK